MNIIIDPEFRDLIPPLSPEEFDQLEKSVVGQGILSPLLVWKEENILIDGHNRHKICTEFKKQFPIKELSFDDREQVKRFIILNQLGRRNVTPETASMLRAAFAESMSKGQGAPIGNNRAEKQKPHNEVFDSEPQSTSSAIAKATGVSKATVERDVQLGKALDKLGIDRSDYAAGKVRDANGKKRSKSSIIAEAFPPKPKEEKLAVVTTPEPEPEHQYDAPLMSSIVIEDEEPQPPKKEIPLDQDPWLITLQQLPKLTKNQRQDLFLILQSKWDCRPVQS
jgi:hypothetical protein